MHEEYLPGYDWEEFIEEDLEKGTPLDDQKTPNKDRTPPRKRRRQPDEE